MTQALLGATGPSALWYLTRGTGAVALLLLTLGVVLGIASSARWRSEGWPRFVTAGLHRNVTLLVLVFIAAHVLTTVADRFAPIGLKDAVVPFVSPYRPIWLGLGALAFDLLIALVVTSLLRARIGYGAWRRLHWLAYLSWPVALVHGLGTGSDAKSGWLVGLSVLCTLAVAGMLIWRLAVDRERPARARLAGALATVAVPIAVLVWYQSGPAQAGWAAHAGTPASLRATARSPSAVSASQTTARASTAIPAPPFSANLSGSIAQSGPDENGELTVQVDARTSGGANGVLHLTLWGQALADGGVSMRDSRVTFGPVAEPALYVGRIVSLSGTRLVSALTSNSGQTLDLHVRLRIDSATGTVSGVALGQAGGE